MALFFMANTAISVPSVLDTSPCMKQMLSYEDCVLDIFPFECLKLKNASIFHKHRIIFAIVQLSIIGACLSNFSLKSANVPQQEVVHPQWPTIWPRLLTDGKLLDFDKVPFHPENIYNYTYMRPLTKKNKQYLYECEEERFVYKACLRKVISLKKSDKHTSWDTAEISNLQLT